MWATLMYFPSPEMPMKKMSKFTYWYTYQDLYLSELDRLTDCLQTMEIKQCKCGSSVIDFYGHSMQFHPEFINPDGSLKENAVAELQKIEPSKKSTTLQETSDSPVENKEPQCEEHHKTVESEQKVNYKKRSDRQEISSEAEPHPRASSIRTDQEVSVIPTISAEIKSNVEKRRNVDTDGEQIPCNIDPVSEDTEQLYNARDDDKDGVSGPDIGNHEKELEYTEHSMWAITKNYSKKTDITLNTQI